MKPECKCEKQRKKHHATLVMGRDIRFVNRCQYCHSMGKKAASPAQRCRQRAGTAVKSRPKPKAQPKSKARSSVTPKRVQPKASTTPKSSTPRKKRRSTAADELTESTTAGVPMPATEPIESMAALVQLQHEKQDGQSTAADASDEHEQHERERVAAADRCQDSSAEAASALDDPFARELESFMDEDEDPAENEGLPAQMGDEKQTALPSAYDVLQKLFRWPFHVIDVMCRWRKTPASERMSASQSKKIAEGIAREVEAEGYRRVHDSRGEGTAAATGDQHRISTCRSLLNSMAETSMSTSFSGVDTPAVSFMQLRSALCEELGLAEDDAPLPRNHFGIEWNKAAQEELLSHPHGPDHLFSDVSEFWAVGIRERIPSMIEAGAVESLLVPLVVQGQASVDTAWCLRHGKYCKAGASSRMDVQWMCDVWYWSWSVLL